jgi:hypothetical protein
MAMASIAIAKQLMRSALALRQWSPRRQYDAMRSFVRYAVAFEKAYARDDWSLVEPYLADDIIWTVSGVKPPIGGASVGRVAALAAIQRSCAYFDRRFDRREPRATEGPIPIPGGVFLGWSATYRREGLPAVVLLGAEWDFFRDGKLVFHREHMANTAEVMSFVERHDAALLPAT